MSTKLDTFSPGSPGWHEQRSRRLGGSEISAVLGLSPWESRFSLWHRKAGTIPPQPDTTYTEWGRRLEPLIRDAWLERHRDTHLVRPVTGWVFEGDEPWQLASPDAIVTRRDPHVDPRAEVLEIKTTDSANAWHWGRSGGDAAGVPIYYVCQVRWYLGALGLTRAHVAVLIGGSDFREYTIEHDPDDWSLMVDAGREFIASLEAGTPPDIDDNWHTYEAVRQVHPDIDTTASVTIAADLAGDYLGTVADLKTGEKHLTHLKAQILDQMGSARTARDPDGTEVAIRIARTTKTGEPGTPYLQPTRKALAS